MQMLLTVIACLAEAKALCPLTRPFLLGQFRLTEYGVKSIFPIPPSHPWFWRQAPAELVGRPPLADAGVSPMSASAHAFPGRWTNRSSAQLRRRKRRTVDRS